MAHRNPYLLIKRRKTTGSPAIDVGAALPKDIAEALDWPTTGKADLGAYQTGIDVAPPGPPADENSQQPNEAFQAYLALIIR